jgi:hypothetical protein
MENDTEEGGQKEQKRRIRKGMMKKKIQENRKNMNKRLINLLHQSFTFKF